MIAIGDPAPALASIAATGEHFDLASPQPRPRSLLIEFHRGTW